MSADVSQLRALVREMQTAPAEVQKGVRPVVSKGALNIKTEMQMDLASSTHFRGITFSVSYDVKLDAGGVEAEIGPDKGREGGALANIAYFGSSRGGGTVRDPVHVLENEGPRFETALGNLLDGVL